jgi:zinc transport system substrate-binding protein
MAAQWTRRSFISFHSSWVYFADRYGLTQASVIEEQPGQEISPSALADITQLVRSKHINVLIAEPQFSRKSLDLLAGETGASVVVLDALGGQNGLGYLDQMRQNVFLLDSVLR